MPQQTSSWVLAAVNPTNHCEPGVGLRFVKRAEVSFQLPDQLCPEPSLHGKVGRQKG